MAELQSHLGVRGTELLKSNFTPRYNIAPTQLRYNGAIATTASLWSNICSVILWMTALVAFAPLYRKDELATLGER